MMPGIQELIALGIVALVVGLFLRRRWLKRKASQRGGDCGDCASSGPPKTESTVHFYRRHDQ